jgi:hypothetical protein
LEVVRILKANITGQQAKATGNDLNQRSDLSDDAGMFIVQMLSGRVLHGRPPSDTPLNISKLNYGITVSMDRAMRSASTDDFDFDVFMLDKETSHRPLSSLAFWAMSRLDLIDALGLEELKLARYLTSVEDRYPELPYHNRCHAATVLQTAYMLLTRCCEAGRFTPIQQLAFIIAAVVHDMDHRGRTNAHLVRWQDALAVRYNDRSPMENHHVATAFEVMAHPDHKFAERLSEPMWWEFRGLVVNMVLATDLGQHFATLTSAGDLLCIAMKCADVSHTSAAEPLHRLWVQNLEEELYQQGDQDKAAGRALDPLTDRSRPGLRSSQRRFFEIVVVPMHEQLVLGIPGAQVLLAGVRANHLVWQAEE